MIIADYAKRNPETSLATVGTLAAGAFSLLASQVVTPRGTLGDLKLRSRIPSYTKKQKEIAFQFGYLGKELAVLPIATLIGAGLWKSQRKHGAAAVLAGTALGVAASHAFDITLPQRTPPPGRRAPLDPHFPSGHALHSGSLILTAGYVLVRENIVSAKAAAMVGGAIGAALGIDRLIQDRHWTSDVAGGWLAAVSIACLTAGTYELLAPRKRKAPRRRPRKAVAQKKAS